MTNPPPPDEAPSDSASPRRAKRRLPLFTLTLLAFLLGAACGLFFGDYCAPLAVAADVYVGLLQMTVLPYIVVALIGNVGRLSTASARRLVMTAGCVLLLLWSMGMIAVAALGGVFPERQTASFFHSDLLQSPPPVDLVALFVPANPFSALADSVVPAIVVFSLCLGAAVMRLPQKSLLLAQLELWQAALVRVNTWMVRLTPIGMFAITAHAAGTLELDDFLQLQGYLLVYTAAVVVLALVVLPLWISLLTGIRYRELAACCREPLATVLATGKLITVLPLITENTARLIDQHHIDRAAADPHVVTPLAYPFPNLGKLMTLLFIPFAAWLSGAPLAFEDYPLLLGAGLVSYFGSLLAAVPFLLDMARLPAESFHLFLISGVYCGRVGEVLGVMHLTAISLLAPALAARGARVNWRRIAAAAGGSAAALILTIVGTGLLLQQTTAESRNGRNPIASMRLINDAPPAEVLRLTPAAQSPAPTGAALSRIRETGLLRVGYHADNLPFSYFNQRGELVGLDIELAHQLARELNVQLQFLPFEFETLAEQLERGEFDVAMSGLAITTPSLKRLRFTRPYLETTLAVVTRDFRRREFASIDELAGRDDLKIAVLRSEYYADKVRDALPAADVRVVASPRDFFDAPDDEYDALAATAEFGSAWTLLYPGFQVVVVQPDLVRVPLGFAVDHDDEQFEEFLSHWIELSRGARPYRRAYRHWIEGEDFAPKERRWCLGRDVLGWLP